MKLSTQKILDLNSALRALDGYEDAVELNDGKFRPVVRPFKLDGAVRRNIATSILSLKKHLEAFEQVRLGIIKEIVGAAPDQEADIAPDDRERNREFRLRIAPELRNECEVRGLVRVKMSQLNMDAPIKNPIPGSVIATLRDCNMLVDDSPKETAADLLVDAPPEPQAIAS